MSIKEIWNEKILPFFKKIWKPVAVAAGIVASYFLYRNIQYRLSEAKRELDSVRAEQRKLVSAVGDAQKQQRIAEAEAVRLTGILREQSRILAEAEQQLTDDTESIDKCRDVIDESRRIVSETRSILEKYEQAADNQSNP